jgi:hypothetical protein
MVDVLPDGDVSSSDRDEHPTRQLVTQAVVGHDSPLIFSTDDGQGKLRLLNLEDFGAPRRKPGEAYLVRRKHPIEWPATATAYGSAAGRAVLGVGSYGGAVWLWDIEKRSVLGGPFADIPDSLGVGGVKRKARSSGPVTSVAIGQVDGRDVMAAACDGHVGLWDVASQARLPSPDMGTTLVAAVALGTLSGRSALVTGSQGGILTVWDASRSERIAGIRLDTRIEEVWVVRGADIVGALTEDRVLHLCDVCRGAYSRVDV